MIESTSGGVEISAPFDNIPAELRERDQWVLWESQTRDGRQTKVPLVADQSGRLASTTNASTWRPFELARGAAARQGLGLGFVFTADDPYCGVDLDECAADGDIGIPEALELVCALDGYTEWSPSRRGVHVIVKAELNGGRNRTSDVPWGGLEVYDRGRFFTVTGDVIAGGPVVDRQAQIGAMTARWLTEAPRAPQSPAPGALSDADVLERARGAANGAKFSRLWAGDATGYPSESEADLALLGVLAFWTRDPDQLDRLFCRSGLYREKHDRDDYRARTIAKALSGGETYSGPQQRPPAAESAPRENGAAPPNGYRLPWRGLDAIVADLPDEPEWVLPGYIAPSTETLIFGPPKVGKTTLLFRLLAALENGGTMLGLPVRRLSYALLTEESAWTIREKMFDFDLRGHGGEAITYQDSHGVTWVEVIQETVQRCKEKGHELLIVDTFPRWSGLTGESENHAGAIQEAWRPFSAAKEANLATVVAHYPRKSGGKHGEGIRGSNAVAALPDVLIELARCNSEDPRARVLKAESRWNGTPSEMGLIFTGDDYEVTSVQSLRTPSESERKTVEALAAGPATIAQLADRTGLAKQTVTTRLRMLVSAGTVTRTGIGSGQDPYVHTLVDAS
jgi:NrS-1  polymerase HBD domain/AAA domain/Winged helix-turn-helix DNA-binding